MLLKLNNTLPFSNEYNALLKELLGENLGEGSFVVSPFYINLANNLHIGKKVFINTGFKCMSAGKIYIEDNVQIAFGVSIITNNHDFYQRDIITIKDVRIKKGAWMGANSTIL